MKNSVKAGATYLTVSSLFYILSGYGVHFLLARYLGPEQFGIYGIIISLISLVNIVQISGITQTISKFVSENPKNSEVLLRTGLFLQSLLSFLLFFLFYFFPEFIAYFFNDYKLTPFLKTSAWVFPLYGFYALYSDYYNGLHNFKKQAFLNILYSLARFIAIIILSLIYGLPGVFLGLVLAPIIPLFVGIKIPKINLKLFSLKTIILFSAPLIGFTLLSNLQQSIDLFLLKRFSFSNEVIGYYAASQNISRIPFFAISSLFLVMFPVVSHSVKNNSDIKTKQIIETYLRFLLIIIIPVVVLISATSHQIVTLIYSNEYAPAGASLSLLALGVGSFTIFTAVCYLLNSSGNPRLTFYFTLISLMTAITLCYILIPVLGPIGAALSTVISNTVAMIIAYLKLNELFGLHNNLLRIAKILVASFLIYMLVVLLNVSSFYFLLLYPLMMGIYLLILLFLKEITSNDLIALRDLLPNKFITVWRKQ